MAATAESWGTALQVLTSILAPLQARPKQDNGLPPSHAAARSPRLRVQLRVLRHHAPPSSLATPARTAQVPATKTEKMPAAQTETDQHAQEGTRAAGGTSKPCSLAAAPGPAAQADSIACHPQGETPHPGDVAQYLAVLDSEPEPLEELESTAAGPSREEQRDLTQEEEQRDAATKDPSGGRQQKEATSNLHQDPDAAQQQGPGSPHNTGRDSAGEAVSHAQSASLALSGPTNAEPAASAQAAGPVSEGDKEPLRASAPRDANSPSPLPAAMPDPSTNTQGRPSTLQDRVKINWDVYGRSSFLPAMRTIPSGEREGCQLSWWNVSWPSSVRVPRLRRTRAAHDGDTAAGTAPSASGSQEMAVRTAGQHLPYLCTATSKTTLQDVQEEWEESPKREAVAEADDVPPSTSPAPSGEAAARPSAAPMAAVPRPEDLTPVCMPEDGKSSASPLAADPVEEASTAPLTQSACEEEEAAPSPLAGGLPQEVSSEPRGSAQRSSHFQAVPEEGPGTTALPHVVAHWRWPNLFRTALQALRRAFSCSCITGDREQRREAARTRQLPRDGSFGPEDGASE
ncbi:proline-rich protein 36-like [Cygnus olor]|uniref:proline-rich protein 36-like n=1 Tax=Cygnus olor TaxID=8869 RepID=UPI001ADE8173|nr:proline-rich protein 36-like [Cygnus olor]